MAGSIERIDATVYEMATVTQREAIDAVRKYGSHQKAANALGVSKPAITRKIGRALARATRQGYSPSHGYNAPRGICGEVWHKELGHVSTSNVNIPMINTGRTT